MIWAWWYCSMLANRNEQCRELSKDRMVVLKYKYKDCSLYIIGAYLPHQQCKIANFNEYLGELEGVIKLCKNDGEIVIIRDTNCHFGSEVNNRCTSKTTPHTSFLR